MVSPSRGSLAKTDIKVESLEMKTSWRHVMAMLAAAALVVAGTDAFLFASPLRHPTYTVVSSAKVIGEILSFPQHFGDGEHRRLDF
jgi:hypothetical protein